MWNGKAESSTVNLVDTNRTPGKFSSYANSKNWIGVDLDGTLAKRAGGNGRPIGAPVQAMVDRVNKWLEDGREVRIFTARAGDPKEVRRIKAWLRDNDLPALKITNIKSLAMTEFWDDRAIRVEVDKGAPCKTCDSAKASFAAVTPAEVDFL